MYLFTYLLKYCIISLIILVPLLISVAFFTLAERKIIASIQRRSGPNIVGFWGLLQPLADGLKLIIKEIILPSKSKPILFMLAPLLTLILSFIGWCAIPFNSNTIFVDLNTGILFLLAVSSLGIYSLILSGWASNSKYALLGAIRSISQMISYEISLSLIILPVLICSGSFNLTTIVLSQYNIWFAFPLCPLCIFFFISILAETNRAPFDLAESEAEIVAGYNLEYSGILFALFFLGEYCNMILMSTLCVLLFFGGWLFPYCQESVYIMTIKILVFCFLFIFVRANLPRFRYDQLMDLGWKVFLPITLSYLVLTSSILKIFGGLPIAFK